MENNIKFDIYGTCVCRDLFGLIPDNEYEVKTFLQSSSQIVNFVFPTKPQKLLTEEDMTDITSLSSFKKKCIISDYNKIVLKQFEEKADYFILDLVYIANTNLIREKYKNGEEHLFTKSLWFTLAYEAGLKNFFDTDLETLNRLKLIDNKNYDAIVTKYVDWLINELKYKPEQIILIENKRAISYTNDESLYYFEEGTRYQVNELLEEIYDSFKEKCRGCHSIKMPIGVYADEKHKWGLNDMHFCYEYYEYLYKCVDSIVKNSIEAKMRIEELWKEYSEKINLQLVNIAVKASQGLKSKQLLKGEFVPTMEDYIITEDSQIYSYEKKYIGKTERCYEVTEFDIPYALINRNGTTCYVEYDLCRRGIMGNSKMVGRYWKTVNASTCVIVKEHSLIIRHNGSKSVAQMNIIQALDNISELYGKTVILSVWAKCHEISNDKGRGGTIAIINASDYNQGVFYGKKEFSNREWQKIELMVKLPEKGSLMGLTVCLRANAGKGGEGNAIVEFCEPKLELI